MRVVPLSRMALVSLRVGILTAALASGAAAQAPAINVIELTVPQIQADYAAKKYTAVQLTQAFLARINQFEDHYNAFVSMNPNALAEAAALDAEYARSGPRGPLHGVPVVIKDNIDYGGLVTTAGFEGFSKATGGVDMVPQNDAEVTARLRAAGAIVLGKTNMPDFAGNGTHTRSTVAGVTRNPYALDRVPGGSSGGTATAVNGSFAVLGLGTETGGSIENPASAQALVGVKVTFGLVPMHGVVPIDATYRDVVGPIARTVQDAAIALDVLAGPSNKDLASYAGVGHIPEGGYANALNPTSLAGKRFGLVGLGWRTQFLPLAPETEAEYQKAIAALKARGAEVVEDPFAGTGWIQAYQTNRGGGGGTAGAHDMLVYLMNLGPNAAFHSIEEWEKLTGREMGGGRGGNPTTPTATEAGDAFGAWRMNIRALFRKVMTDNRLDGLFFPQAGAPITMLVEDPSQPAPNNHPELPSNIINDVGLPVVTVPFSYYADGTPFVIAFIGDMWTEPQLLGYAYDFEQATKGRRPPTLVPKPTR